MGAAGTGRENENKSRPSDGAKFLGASQQNREIEALSRHRHRPSAARYILIIPESCFFSFAPRETALYICTRAHLPLPNYFTLYTCVRSSRLPTEPHVLTNACHSSKSDLLLRGEKCRLAVASVCRVSRTDPPAIRLAGGEIFARERRFRSERDSGLVGACVSWDCKLYYESLL